MAKNKGGQRARRQARQAKRARAEAQLAASPQAQSQDAGKGSSKAVQAKPKAQAAKAEKQRKPGLIRRGRTYLHDVRVEMRRVVWPSGRELRNYSLAVIAMLIVFGVAVWLVDTGVVALLVGYSGLRG